MMITKTPLKKGSSKLINAWAFYDWANSVYSLVISSAIFPIYYGAIFSDINTINILGYQIKNTLSPKRRTNGNQSYQKCHITFLEKRVLREHLLVF